jgi:hypothetical protein
MVTRGRKVDTTREGVCVAALAPCGRGFGAWPDLSRAHDLGPPLGNWRPVVKGLPSGLLGRRDVVSSLGVSTRHRHSLSLYAQCAD